MPDGLHSIAGSEAGASSARHDRLSAIAFVASSEFGVALRDGLVDWIPDLEVRRGGIRAAINALAYGVQSPHPHRRR